MVIRHFVFDAYGTLLDVHSPVARLAGRIGPEADRLSQVWRQKQLEYTWVRAAAGRHGTFRQMTEQGLDYAIAVTGGGAASLRGELLAAYEALTAYPEVAGVLAALKARGTRLAVLSNGDPDMLETALRAAGILDAFDAVLSVAEAGLFKPSPAVYALATRHFGVEPGDIAFQSSNRWDIAGAKAFGFHTHWINRAGLPDEYPDLPADRTLPSLSPLADGTD
jgi:2-haloacid dehalogenase